VVVDESTVGAELRALGGDGGSVDVLVYDAVDAGAVVILASRTTSDRL